MMERKENERGAIMVEVLAVIALLGTMGTLLFRQVIQRNQELDNINIATEMRILKEGFFFGNGLHGWRRRSPILLRF